MQEGGGGGFLVSVQLKGVSVCVQGSKCGTKYNINTGFWGSEYADLINLCRTSLASLGTEKKSFYCFYQYFVLIKIVRKMNHKGVTQRINYKLRTKLWYGTCIWSLRTAFWTNSSSETCARDENFCSEKKRWLNCLHCYHNITLNSIKNYISNLLSKKQVLKQPLFSQV